MPTANNSTANTDYTSESLSFDHLPWKEDVLTELPKYKNLKSLSFAHCNLTADQILEILKVVFDCPTIEILNLSNNQMGAGHPDTLQDIYDYLKYTPHLRMLDISHNNKDEKTAFGNIIIIEILRNNEYLSVFEATHNHLSDNVFQNINAAKNLEILDLSFNWNNKYCPPRQIVEDIIYLNNHGFSLSTLKELYIDSTFTGEYQFAPITMGSGSPDFERLLKRNFNLRKLNFSGMKDIPDWQDLPYYLERNDDYQNNKSLQLANEEKDPEKAFELYQKALTIAEEALSARHPDAEKKLREIKLALGKRYLELKDFVSAWEYLSPFAPYLLEVRIALANFILLEDLFPLDEKDRSQCALGLLGGINGADTNLNLIQQHQHILRRAMALLTNKKGIPPELKQLIGKQYVITYSDLLLFLARHELKNQFKLATDPSRLISPSSKQEEEKTEEPHNGVTLMELLSSFPSEKKIIKIKKEFPYDPQLLEDIISSQNWIQFAFSHQNYARDSLEETIYAILEKIIHIDFSPEKCETILKSLKTFNIREQDLIGKIIATNDFAILEILQKNPDLDFNSQDALKKLKDYVKQEQEKFQKQKELDVQTLDLRFQTFMIEQNDDTLDKILEAYNDISAGDKFDKQRNTLQMQLLNKVDVYLRVENNASLDDFNRLQKQYEKLIDPSVEKEFRERFLFNLLGGLRSLHFEGVRLLNLKLLIPFCEQYDSSSLTATLQRCNDSIRDDLQYFRIRSSTHCQNFSAKINYQFNQLIEIKKLLPHLKLENFMGNLNEETLEQITDSVFEQKRIETLSHLFNDCKEKYQYLFPNNAHLLIIQKSFAEIARRVISPLKKNAVLSFFDSNASVTNGFHAIFTDWRYINKPWIPLISLYALIESNAPHFKNTKRAMLQVLCKTDTKQDILNLLEKTIIALMPEKLEINDWKEMIPQIQKTIDSKKPLSQELIQQLDKMNTLSSKNNLLEEKEIEELTDKELVEKNFKDFKRIFNALYKGDNVFKKSDIYNLLNSENLDQIKFLKTLEQHIIEKPNSRAKTAINILRNWKMEDTATDKDFPLFMHIYEKSSMGLFSHSNLDTEHCKTLEHVKKHEGARTQNILDALYPPRHG